VADGRAGTPTMAVVDVVTAVDLAACAARVEDWHDAGLATPLVLEASEFGRSLDAFPLEFGSILAHHVVVSGTSPFEGLRVDPADLRRACERQARSHLLHLREGYLETRGRSDLVADLILRSAPPLAGLLKSVARLHGAPAPDIASAARHVESAAGLPSGILERVANLAAGGSLAPDQARTVFASYLDAIDRLTEAIDRWGTS
jgi:hypothetical protein